MNTKMPEIHVMARIVARAESAATVEEALSELVTATRQEAGCLAYELYRRADRPCEFVTVERWRDNAAAETHMATPHVATAFAKVGALLAEPPGIHRYERVS